MTLDQEQRIRETFRAGGVPDHVGQELTAVLPYLVALTEQQKRKNPDDPFPEVKFYFRLGDNNYCLRFEEV